MSAYFLFSVATRSTVKAENPEASFGDIARLISAKFKALSAKERKIWDDRAVEDKERYDREMEEYNS
jgi:HMG (high mobility group) box